MSLAVLPARRRGRWPGDGPRRLPASPQKTTRLAASCSSVRRLSTRRTSRGVHASDTRLPGPLRATAHWPGQRHEGMTCHAPREHHVLMNPAADLAFSGGPDWRARGPGSWRSAHIKTAAALGTTERTRRHVDCWRRPCRLRVPVVQILSEYTDAFAPSPRASTRQPHRRSWLPRSRDLRCGAWRRESHRLTTAPSCSRRLNRSIAARPLIGRSVRGQRHERALSPPYRVRSSRRPAPGRSPWIRTAPWLERGTNHPRSRPRRPPTDAPAWRSIACSQRVRPRPLRR